MPAGKTYENIVQTVTLSSFQTSVTFTNISQAYTDLVLVGSVKSNTNGAAVVFRVNDLNTAASYGHTWMTRSNSATYSGLETSAAYGVVGWYTTPGTNVNGYMFIADFLNYTGTHHFKTVLSKATSVGSDSVYLGNERVSSQVATTSPITSLRLTMQESGTNGFSAGTTFTLYGIKAA